MDKLRSLAAGAVLALGAGCATSSARVDDRQVNVQQDGVAADVKFCMELASPPNANKRGVVNRVSDNDLMQKTISLTLDDVPVTVVCGYALEECGEPDTPDNKEKCTREPYVKSAMAVVRQRQGSELHITDDTTNSLPLGAMLTKGDPLIIPRPDGEVDRAQEFEVPPNRVFNIDGKVEDGVYVNPLLVKYQSIFGRVIDAARRALRTGNFRQE